MNTIFLTPEEVAKHIGHAAKEKRLSLNLSQHTLSERSGVSFGVLKKFEQTGKISLESLLKVALALGRLEEFFSLFKLTTPEELHTLDDVLKEKTRKRGRQ